jgi:hypothetical protein
MIIYIVEFCCVALSCFSIQPLNESGLVSKLHTIYDDGESNSSWLPGERAYHGGSGI